MGLVLVYSHGGRFLIDRCCIIRVWWTIEMVIGIIQSCALVARISSMPAIMESLSSARSPTIRASIVALIIIDAEGIYICCRRQHIIQVSKIPVYKIATLSYKTSYS